jgi:hypothetical protein
MDEQKHKIIDGDGHVVEDLASIVKYMPEEYVGRSFSEARGKNPFPPIDHLHSANRHYTPKGAFANVGREGWELFLEDVGIGTTVLYTSAGSGIRQRFVSRDWAIELARAYNNWMYDTYTSKSQRFKAMGLIPLQEPAEADHRTAAHCARSRILRRHAAVHRRQHAAVGRAEVLAHLRRGGAARLRVSDPRWRS